MEIHFKISHNKDGVEDISPKAKALAQRRLFSLKKYFAKRKGVAQIYVEVGKESGAHQNGNIWKAVINLDSDGDRFHAESVTENVEVALTSAIRELEQEVRRAKQRKESMFRKGGTALKSLARGFGFN